MEPVISVVLLTCLLAHTVRVTVIVVVTKTAMPVIIYNASEAGEKLVDKTMNSFIPLGLMPPFFVKPTPSCSLRLN